jgi:hypothetical protein
MAMRRLILTCLLALSAVAVVAAVPGVATAKKSGPTPVITRVAPMRISVGHVLVIRGRHFRSTRKRNTIIFRSNAGRTAFAKPTRASAGKLVVRVPAAVAHLLTVKNAKQRPTRLKLRVLAGKFSKYTSRRLSPVVTGVGEGDGGGSTTGACDTGTDFDGDLLSNSLELAIGTDPCLRDTDKDGVEDGFEYQSALDLNHYPVNPPLPYPGKRPYPNALDPSDAGTDYDGDGLVMAEEFAGWLDFSSDGHARSGRPASLSNLSYSDGLQRSESVAAPADTLSNWVLDQDGDGLLSDDERDVDGDGIGNWDEQHGRFTEVWWPAEHDGSNEPKESKYYGINFLDVADLSSGLAMVVADMDGDGVVDGNDDQDHDGLSNKFELRRPADWLTFTQPPLVPTGWTNAWVYVNPFNPCKPYFSARCHTHPPFGYYASDEVSWYGPTPPAGFPNTHPTTPGS